jgi:hypothetical protein
MILLLLLLHVLLQLPQGGKVEHDRLRQQIAVAKPCHQLVAQLNCSKRVDAGFHERKVRTNAGQKHLHGLAHGGHSV